MNTYIIHITGLVQGVGFRPFIYRVATELGLAGEVENRNDGVYISINADRRTLATVIRYIWERAPVASHIDHLVTSEGKNRRFSSFRIIKSENVSGEITGVSPDIAVCDDCLSDMKSQVHRINYPFINCTNCGPRFTIVKDLPYDRAKTTMHDFAMCDKCKSEYTDILDRRFHAQPVACNNCGPVYSIDTGDKEMVGNALALEELVRKIREGGIVALKGTGGFHLLCDATNEASVRELRMRKQREGKPFAVMCADLKTAQTFAFLDQEEKYLLLSWQRPVVILRSKKELAFSVSNGLDTVGVILPYMPIHYLLFEKLPNHIIVFTSANLSEEPLLRSNAEARERLSGIADLIITYNRDIHNRADDSVASVMAGQPVLIRRSRGYAPSSVRIKMDAEGIFAAGAELASSFAIGKGKEAILSQFIGDLKNQSTFEFYKETYDLLKRLFRFTPKIIARDYHPDYLSSGFANFLSSEFDLPQISVQHHHAHVAACMAEHHLEEPVIGLGLDGVGLGTDGNIWGGEILVADFHDFKREYHFDYIPILGADKVSKEPWRSALSYIMRYMDVDQVLDRLDFSRDLTSEQISMYRHGLGKRINTHLYSGAGRLFDAVAVICGISSVSLFHSEAPMRLEAKAVKGIKESYGYTIESDIISFGKTINQVVEDILNGRSDGEVSARFHNTVVFSLAEAVERVATKTKLNRVVLTGGSFQNRLLTGGLAKLLSGKNYQVYLHREVPPNDGGIALGQLAVAATGTKG